MGISGIVSIAIFVATFIFILTERIHRTVIALAGAIAMIVAGIALDFYSAHEAIGAIDFNTIGLLFGMMVLVVMLERTGFFQYLGIVTAKKTRGRPWLLLVALGGLTAGLSLILDNVTTIILIAPVTIIIARMVGISPLPILLGEAMLSNVGGAGSLVGDPPNIMIGSAADLSFNAFLIHAFPVALVAWGATLLFFRFFHREALTQDPQNIDKLMTMDEREAITEPQILKKTLAVLGLVVALFFLHGALHLEPAIVALIGAALILLLGHAKDDPQPVLEKTELSVLLFFASLFMLVGGLEAAGVLEAVSQLLIAGATDNLFLTAVAVLWVSAVLSAVVDNIPFTVAMIPVIGSLAAQGVPVELLWWALVFGVGFGGNATPIGSSAGVIVTAKSEQTEEPISFLKWMKTGVPATIAALIIATGGLFVLDNSGMVSDSGSVAQAQEESFAEAE